MSQAIPVGRKPDQVDAADANVHAPFVLKAARGAVALVVRQFLTYGSNITGGVLLARFLSPAQFGFYAVVSLFLAFLNIFGGTGFAGNLIRTPQEPQLKEYRAVFTFQQLIVGIILIAVWSAAPTLATMYHFGSQGAIFFRLTGIALFLTSLMVIPQVKMERELDFDKLALIEVSQAVAFNVLAVGLAWRGFGILAFAIGLVVRAGLGAVLSNLRVRWAIGLSWDFHSVKMHARYGLTMQSGQIISMLKDSITPVFVGIYLGAAQMGYATWAMSFASYSILLLMPMQRLYLPFFARFQGDPSTLDRYATRTFWMANAVAAPLILVSVALARPITVLVFGEKWLVALPLFYCFAAGNFFSPCSTPMLGLLNALGKSHLTLSIICVWMLTTWLFGVPLMMVFGIFGFGLAMLGVQLTNLLLYWLVWKETGVLPWRSYWPSWPIALLVGAGLFILEWIAPAHHMATLAAYGCLGLLAYAVAFQAVASRETRELRRAFRSAS